MIKYHILYDIISYFTISYNMMDIISSYNVLSYNTILWYNFTALIVLFDITYNKI